MNKVQTLFNSESADKVRTAIRRAEAKTSAEIIPMIVWQSTPNFHVWPLLFLIFGLLASFLFPHIPINFLFPLQAGHVAVLLFILSVGASYILARVGFIQNFLTPDAIEEQQVYQRAMFEFYQLQMQKTAGQTGILLFVSVRERRAVVLADSSISSAVPKETWSEIIGVLTSTARQTSMTEGVVKAIELTGEKLMGSFPRGPQDVNELPDKLILKP